MARFDLNLLSALDALLTERNVTRAACKLRVTQPTMSGMLQRLRYQFDDQLLVRNGRGMELTPFGNTLTEPVREALRGIESLVRAEPSFDPQTSTRSFKIMASDYCTSIFMPRIVAHLAKYAPRVGLVIQSLNAPVERMLCGDIDLCITADDRGLLCRDAGEDKLLSDYLFSDDFVCVVAEDHPLRGDATLEEYLSYPHVGVKIPGVLSTIEAASLLAYAPRCKPNYVVADFSMVASMVAYTDLVGVIQKRLARVAARTLPIRMFPPPFAIPALNEAMMWHPRHLEDSSHTWFRGVLLKEAAALFGGTAVATGSTHIPAQVMSCRDRTERPLDAVGRL